MNQRMRAVYRQGAFVPETACDLPEEAEVELFVQGPLRLPPSLTDPAEVSRRIAELTRRMQHNPIRADAPRYSRDQLHERG